VICRTLDMDFSSKFPVEDGLHNTFFNTMSRIALSQDVGEYGTVYFDFILFY
jgi:hypothetical protein